MSEYTFVQDVSEKFNGSALLYKNEAGRHVVVSRADTFDRGDETMIFRSNGSGDVLNWTDLYAGYGETHEEALSNWLNA